MKQATTKQEEDTNWCRNECGCQSLKPVYSLSATYGIDRLREWLLNWGLEIHPLLRWGQFCVYGSRQPSNQPQLRHLLWRGDRYSTNRRRDQYPRNRWKRDCYPILNKWRRGQYLILWILCSILNNLGSGSVGHSEMWSTFRTQQCCKRGELKIRGGGSCRDNWYSMNWRRKLQAKQQLIFQYSVMIGDTGQVHP